MPSAKDMLRALSTSRSIWKETDANPIKSTYSTLQNDVAVDVAVVGAGITGLTTALLLMESGKRVAVIDRATVGSGTSGFNSGHLTSVLLDTSYGTVLENFGLSQSLAVARSQRDAIDLIEKLVQIYQIDCGFERIPGYLYAETPEQLETMLDEFSNLRKLGFTVHLCDHVPLPFPLLQGARIENQARFHPLKYVQALAREVAKTNDVFENTPAEHIEYGETCRITTSSGSIRARHVVLATHSPIDFWPMLQTRLQPMQSYVIAMKVPEHMVADALYWDAQDNYHYIRKLAVETAGRTETYLIIGGEDHHTGESIDTTQCFHRLEQFAQDHWLGYPIKYRWSAELFHPADGLPYIGAMHSHPNVYVATGFSGEGLTGGTYAASILSDLILEKPNPLSEIYDPNRVKPVASAQTVLTENLHTLGRWVGDRVLPKEAVSPRDVPPGEGCVGQVDGKAVAMYRDPKTQELLCLSPVCTHMGCHVAWNPAEKTWDCPCHGGRFAADGRVLEGPPMADLAQAELQIPIGAQADRHQPKG